MYNTTYENCSKKEEYEEQYSCNNFFNPDEVFSKTLEKAQKGDAESMLIVGIYYFMEFLVT